MILNIGYNRRVSSDLHDILEYYEKRGGKKLGDEFFDELTATVQSIRSNPSHFPYYRDKTRRANLTRFPYHLIYEIRPDIIWVFVLRHDRRDPDYGLRRS
jgi:plasmid stabilization system protein ParE